MISRLAKQRIRWESLLEAVTRGFSTATARGETKPLYRRLSAIGSAPKGSVEKTMNAWVDEGGAVSQQELMALVKELRRYKNFSSALELTDWMEKKGIELTFKSHAVRLDLLYKVKGIDVAERYFFSLPEAAKNQKTYGALLSNYCQEQMADKAIALYEKLKDMGASSSTLIYNNMMTLHSKLGQTEKVIAYFEEMKAAGIFPDTASVSLLINSYASLNDIDSVEKVVEEIKKNDHNTLNWSIYCNLASLYNSSGLFAKSESALKKAEKTMNPRDPIPYQFLISLYAGAGNLAEVKRVWKLLKAAFRKTTNRSYFSVLDALRKLDDIDGLTKSFEEWESGYELYDVRLMNIVLDAYIKKGMAEEAESLWARALEKGVGSDFRTLDIFLNYYMERQNVDLATKCLKLMDHTKKPYSWKPHKEKVNMFLKHFEEVKDVDGAEEVCKTLKKLGHLDAQAYKSLLRTYLAAGRKDSSLRQRITEDGIELSSEIVVLLENVCSV